MNSRLVSIFRWCIFLSIFAVLFLSFSYRANADTEEILAIEEYWELMQELKTVLTESNPNLAELQEFADQLEGITAVSLQSGEVVPLDHNYLIAQLRQGNPDQEKISQYVSTLITTWETWEHTAFPANSTATLEKILSSPEFQWKNTERSLLSQWINQLIQRLLDFFAGLFPEGSGEGSAVGIPGLDILLTTASIFVVLLIVGFIARQLATGFVQEASRDLEDDLGGEVTTSRSAYQRARQLSQGGDYRSAVRYLYLSSLLLLEERRLLRYDRAKTNREYLQDISEHPDLENVLEDVVNVYDRVWYGYQDIEADDFDQFSERVSDLNKLK